MVFPKTYAKTKMVWEVGNVLCVVGKTPREEGDNKLFVENVYVLDCSVLDRTNLEERHRLSSGMYLDNSNAHSA